MKTLPTEPEYIRLMNTLLKIIDECNLKDTDKFCSIVCLLNYIISFELDKYEQDKMNISLKNELDKGSQTLFKESLTKLPTEDCFVL